jgi:hypothetical protein
VARGECEDVTDVTIGAARTEREERDADPIRATRSERRRRLKGGTFDGANHTIVP